MSKRFKLYHEAIDAKDQINPDALERIDYAGNLTYLIREMHEYIKELETTLNTCYQHMEGMDTDNLYDL